MLHVALSEVDLKSRAQALCGETVTVLLRKDTKAPGKEPPRSGHVLQFSLPTGGAAALLPPAAEQLQA